MITEFFGILIIYILSAHQFTPSFKTLAGVPPITQWSGKCFPVTIAPLAMILWLPIRAPLSTFTEWPIHTWLPTAMSADGFIRSPVAISKMLWLSPTLKVILEENRQSSPIVMLLPSITANSVLPVMVVCLPSSIRPPLSSMYRVTSLKFESRPINIRQLFPLTIILQFFIRVNPGSMITLLPVP